MTLRILHSESNVVSLPEGWCELATICNTSRPGYRFWELPISSINNSYQSEVWCVPIANTKPVESKVIDIKSGKIEQCVSDDYALIWLQLDPSGFKDFQAASQYAWQQLLKSRNTQHGELLKAWHYLPGINMGDGDQERYRQFCAGRAEALHALDESQTLLPAATAIGIPDCNAPIVMYWLLGKQAGWNIENPRQTSAWKYPEQYGRVSPNFSRATLDKYSQLLLLSGTASVVGHMTNHPYKTAKQSEEMLQNLDSLLAVVNGGKSQSKPLKNDLQLRVYLRDVNDWSTVESVLIQAGFTSMQLLALQGDVCRSDLMVELDGYAFQSDVKTL